MLKYYILLFASVLLLNLLHNASSASQSLARPAMLTKTQIDPRIVGGYPITIMQAPWQVSVRLAVYDEEMYGSGHICGGSLISQRVVVSAAHCIANEGSYPVTYRSPSEYLLVMGSVYLYEQTSYTLEYNVITIIVNPYFNLTTLQNDVALFFINGYVPTTWPTVQPIQLNTMMEPAGTVCSISGWGTTEPGTSSMLSSVLLGAEVPIVSYATCDTNYGNISIGMMCAGYMQQGGVDSCQGDSGGPLVCNGVLAGIVSFGVSCAQPGYPGVYTNVSYYYDWITGNNNTLNYNYYIGLASRTMFTVLSLAMPLAVLILRKFM